MATTSNPHVWNPSSSMTIEEFTAKYRPSKTLTTEGGGDGFLWVFPQMPEPTNSNDQKHQQDVTAFVQFDKSRETEIEEARQIWFAATQRAEEIRVDDSIPDRRGPGKPCKEFLLHQLATRTRQRLYKVAESGRWSRGRWLFFSTDLDEVWSTLASSVVHGRLSQCAKAKCLFIKAATADNDRNKYFQTTVVSLAFDDCSNRDHAMEILTCCVEAHGIIPVSVKPDLWTLAGIEAQNSVKFRPSIFQASDLMPRKTLLNMQAAHRARSSAKAGDAHKNGLIMATQVPKCNDASSETQSHASFDTAYDGAGQAQPRVPFLQRMCAFAWCQVM